MNEVEKKLAEKLGVLVFENTRLVVLVEQLTAEIQQLQQKSNSVNEESS